MSLNAYTEFARLIKGQPLLLASVSAVNADGTVTVTVNGGGTLRVIGTGYSVGDAVYVQNGSVKGSAPDLPYYEVEV